MSSFAVCFPAKMDIMNIEDSFGYVNANGVKLLNAHSIMSIYTRILLTPNCQIIATLVFVRIDVLL